MDNAIEVAAALFQAIEEKNPAAVAELYTDDIQVWHNFTQTNQDKATNIAVLAGLCEAVPRIRYDVLERLLLPDGRVLQRHVLRAWLRDDVEVEIPACMFIHLRDGHIARIEEYLDTAQVNALYGVMNAELRADAP